MDRERLTSHTLLHPTGYLEQALPYLYACERMGLQLCLPGRRRVLVTQRAVRLDDAL